MSQLYIKKFDGSMLLLLRQPRIWQEVMKAIESGCKELWVDEKAENTNFKNIEGIYYDSKTKVLGIGILEEYKKPKQWHHRGTTSGRWESNGKVTVDYAEAEWDVINERMKEKMEFYKKMFSRIFK